MKKIFFLFAVWLMVFPVQAQRCAVLEFNTGGSVTQEDIDGIFYIFNSNFIPEGYQMLERPTINQAIKDAGYNRTDLTLRQRLAIGRTLTASIIVAGEINLFMDEYNIDVRVISVETGATIASNPVSFKRTEYRENVKALAKNLAEKINPKKNQALQKEEKEEKNTMSPTENSASKTSDTNSSSSLTKNSSNKNVPAGYVDLGLPSGTLWKDSNESGYFTYDEAMTKFGEELPTSEQWQEILSYCKWKWSSADKGYRVISPNGNEILIPAWGNRPQKNEDAQYIGKGGSYWSSTSFEIVDKTGVSKEGAKALLFGAVPSLILPKGFKENGRLFPKYKVATLFPMTGVYVSYSSAGMTIRLVRK